MVFIFLYGIYRCRNSNFDPFKPPLIDSVPWMDGWAFVHFLVYFLIGRGVRVLNRSPWYLILTFAFGIAWEAFEWFAGNQPPGWLYGDCRMSTDKEDGKWWYGQWTDILMNGTGLLHGYGLKTAIG